MAHCPLHHPILLLLLLLFLILLSTTTKAQLVDEYSTSFELPTAYPSAYGDVVEEAEGAYENSGGDLEEDGSSHRRALYWHMHYYISYGALSANRIPCPPRSGRSYYTHHCYRARGRVNPYHRGCSAITRCRR